MLLPDSVIKRTHPSNHKKAALNINISSELLSQNMTAPGSASLAFVWSWYWAGNSHWFGGWKLSGVFPALSQKDPEWIMETFTIGTWLKIWPSQAGRSGQKGMSEYQFLSCILGSPDCSPPPQVRSSHCRHARADPCDFTHLPSATLINNDVKNNSKGHKAQLGLWVIHLLDSECWQLPGFLWDRAQQH